MKKWFTMIEVIIVMVIMSIIMWLTLYMWRGYLQDVQYRQDRDILIWSLDELITLARTSTYYNWYNYDNLDIVIGTGGYTWYISTGEWAMFGEGIAIDRYLLNRSSIILPDGRFWVRLTPYALSCSLQEGTTWFELQSSSSDLSACFEIDVDVCKFKQVSC